MKRKTKTIRRPSAASALLDPGPPLRNLTKEYFKTRPPGRRVDCQLRLAKGGREKPILRSQPRRLGPGYRTGRDPRAMP
jgi:hypothetical protein